MEITHTNVAEAQLPECLTVDFIPVEGSLGILFEVIPSDLDFGLFIWINEH